MKASRHVLSASGGEPDLGFTCMLLAATEVIRLVGIVMCCCHK